MTLTGENRRIRRKTCTSATLPPVNPMLTDPGANPGFRWERSGTNHLNHGTVKLRMVRRMLTSALDDRPDDGDSTYL
jgi:hypothetical protein